ncbi:MAG: hypothetical protein P4L26_07930 [Terracidiphilus sp.]|nr:hypothetical protein [Terracidiphilus sp.]
MAATTEVPAGINLAARSPPKRVDQTMPDLIPTLTSLIANSWWKAFFSLLIPLGQFIWTRYGKEGSDFRKRQLRLKISDLGAQREALNKYADVPNADQALADLNAEMEACMAQLVSVVHRARTDKRDSGRGAPRSGRSLIARWFLVYTPVGPSAWILHSLFYINVLFVLLGLMGVLSTTSEGDTGYGLLGLSIFLIPAFVIRWLARKLDHPHTVAPI